MGDTVSVTFRDDANRKGTHQSHLVGVPHANVLAYAQALAAELDDLASGQIESISVQLDIPLPAGLKAAPAVDSDVTDQARFIVRAADDTTFRVSIPTYDESHTIPGTVQVDRADPAVALLIDRLESGTLGTHYGQGGEQVTEAYETVGKARKAKK